MIVGTLRQLSEAQISGGSKTSPLQAKLQITLNPTTVVKNTHSNVSQLYRARKTETIERLSSTQKMFEIAALPCKIQDICAQFLSRSDLMAR